ncbi:50S ribosomal protein L6 [Candidatus Carsonella ruddii]|uniref:50S ribosomal protein L6 n=1 Tax=Candidatus Carsonella ruddii CE isolate Thao2000 TaxID=1202536 RepID=J7GW40_CARRU|nr:50S ribosomal protein L6 [Candidatus Carsonella ruddii]AFP83626.1 ribosomal protein L6 [Candidatus Carsonella ruddii CE isolate Thao2000]
MKIVKINFYYLIKNNIIFFKKKYFGFLKIPKDISILKNNKFIEIKSFSEEKKNVNSFYKSLFNILKGLDSPWEIILEISGIGYKVYIKEKFLIFNLGFSKEKILIIPNYIKTSIIKNKINLFSIYKDKLGLFANKIILIKKYNPYKKKGIFFINNFFLKKSNKKKQ